MHSIKAKLWLGATALADTAIKTLIGPKAQVLGVWAWSGGGVGDLAQIAVKLNMSVTAIPVVWASTSQAANRGPVQKWVGNDGSSVDYSALGATLTTPPAAGTVLGTIPRPFPSSIEEVGAAPADTVVNVQLVGAASAAILFYTDDISTEGERI